MKTAIASGADIEIKVSEMPEYKLDTLARQTLHAVERFFAMPGVQEEYEKWLVEYRKEKKLKTEVTP